VTLARPSGRWSPANHYLETDLEKLKAAASMGYARGKLFEEVSLDRKDWYD
jgi:hypothetical protein